MGLEELRSKNKGGKLDKLVKAMSRTSAGKQVDYKKEERYYPERNSEGNASAIIRFLPGLDSEDNPYYVQKFQHGFMNNGKWYIEDCPATVGKECPACLGNKDIIAEYGKYEDCPVDVQDLIKKRGRSNGFDAGYYANILVIKDPANPVNEGKVFKFLFGNKIYNLIMEKAQPVDDGLGNVPEPIDIFDLMEGANFKFIIRKKDGRANYDKCEFEAPSKCPVFDVETQFPLLPIINESKFKSFEVLDEIYAKVMNSSIKPARNAEAMSNKDAGSKKPSKEKEPEVPEGVSPADSGTADDSGGEYGSDNLEYFQNLAKDIKI